jgi:regulator of RNase E activity RraA
MALVQGTRDKLTSVGTARIVAALAKQGLRRQLLSSLRPLSPFQDALIGGAAISIDACPPGGVLVMESSVTSAPVTLLARRKVAGIVSNSPLRNAAEIARTGLPAWQRPLGPPPKPLPIEPGDVLFGDRAGVIVIPADRADQVAEEAVEAMAYEEFVAEQVSSGGGVYGLHIPSGEHARRAFAAWRRIKGR